MRVGINCRSFLKKTYTGIGRYAYNLVKSLGDIDQEDEYWLYAQKRFFDMKRQLPRAPAKNFAVKADYFNRGANKVLKGVDVYHSPSLDWIDVQGPKIVVTVHDLIHKTYPQGHTDETIQTVDQQLKEVVDKADKIICCSQSTCDDLHKYFDVDQNKTHVIYQGVDKDVFHPLDKAQQQQGRQALQTKKIISPFILSVGTIEPRKNLKNLFKAFAVLKKDKGFAGQLVVVGMKGWKMEGLQKEIEDLGIQYDTVFCGYMADRELCYLYNLCEVFVFPSFYEGFGFPIVEAFSCQAAVVTSNTSSCAEVAADAALTVDPASSEEIAESIQRLLDDQALKGVLRDKAFERSQDFSFKKTAEETLKIYQGFKG